MAKTLLRLSLCVLFLAAPCLAADTSPIPAWELFAGYSRERSDVREYYKSTPIIYVFRDRDINLDGWEVSVTENVNKWFGGTLQLTGHYKTPVVLGTTNHENMFSILYGPRFAHRMGWGTAFGQVLLGAARASVTVSPGPHATETAFGAAAGAGLDINLGSRVALRVLQAQYSPTNPIGTKKHKYQASAGIVFHVGRAK